MMNGIVISWWARAHRIDRTRERPSPERTVQLGAGGGVLMINEESQTIGNTSPNAGNHFENLNYGIKTWEGGELSSINNTFRHMVYDATIDWSTGTGIYMNEGEALSVTNENVFEDSRFGINVLGVAGDVDISGVAGYKNKFTDLFRAIYINSQNEQVANKDMTIAYNDMTEVEWGIVSFTSPRATVLIEENTMVGAPNADEVAVGIACLEAVAMEQTDITIRENTISDVSHGIWVSAMDENMMIHDNTITVYETASTPAYGIIATDVQNAVISSNLVSGTSSDGDDHRNGIHVGTGILDIIGCNTTEDIGNGLLFGGAMAPSWILKNRMEDNFKGLVLNNGVIGNIGLPDVGSGATSWDNTWYGTWSTGEYHTFAIGQSANNNGMFKLYTRFGETGPPYEPDLNESPVPLWEFMPEVAASGNDLSGIVCPPDVGTQFLITGNEKSAAVKMALTDTSTTGDYYAEVKWSNDLNIYLELLQDDTLRLSDSIITAFYDSCHATNMGKLVRGAQALSGGKDLSDFLDTLNGLSTSVVPEDVWRDVLVIAYDHLLNTTTVTDSTGLRLNELFGTVFPDSSFSVAATKKADYTSMQLSTLETIASACPYEYGIGVYMARTLLSERDTVLYTAINDCEKGPQSASERRGEEGADDEGIDPEHSAFSLYPNPSGGEFQVKLEVGSTDIAEMLIWTLSGQQVHAVRLNSGLNTVRTDVSGGLYLYSVTVNGIPQWNGKLSFLRE